MKLPKTRISQLPDLDQFLSERGANPAEQLSRELVGAGPGSRAISGAGVAGAGIEEGVAPGEVPVDARVKAAAVDPVTELADAAVAAAKKYQEQGDEAEFTEEEVLGLEAIIILNGRPPLIIQDGTFLEPPPDWQVLNTNRASIEATFRSVGRIEVDGHPRLPWVGTGFLVADDVIMTNRHVAVEFSERNGATGWGFQPGMTARIDYVEELGAQTPAEFALSEVIGIHDRFDLALLRVERTSPGGAAGPTPLTLASTPPGDPGRTVFVVGYPAFDSRNDPVVMQRLFGNTYGIKRLQPGTVMRYLPPEGLFHHDCSTLGGNSGSCVIDLEMNQVIGLHFGGLYREANQAVALWQLTEDPLLRSAGLNFD
jgi:V8-like Glu-specific endopeptidase